MRTRMEEQEEQINDTENKITESNAAENKRKREILDYECRLTELSDSRKYQIIGVPEREDGEKGKRFI